MNTQAHAGITAAFTERWAPDCTKVAVLASVMPDLPYLLKGLWIMLRYGRKPRPEELDYYQETNWAIDLLLHSVFPPALLAAMARDRKLRAFALAWLMHVVTDFFCHHTDARPLAYPLIMDRFHAPWSLSEDSITAAWRAESSSRSVQPQPAWSHTRCGDEGGEITDGRCTVVPWSAIRPGVPAATRLRAHPLSQS